jgi:hypothetical protein
LQAASAYPEWLEKNPESKPKYAYVEADVYKF